MIVSGDGFTTRSNVTEAGGNPASLDLVVPSVVLRLVDGRIRSYSLEFRAVADCVSTTSVAVMKLLGGETVIFDLAHGALSTVVDQVASATRRINQALPGIFDTIFDTKEG